MKYPTIDVYVSPDKVAPELQRTVGVNVNGETWPVISCDSRFHNGMTEITLKFRGTICTHDATLTGGVGAY